MNVSYLNRFVSLCH